MHHKINSVPSSFLADWQVLKFSLNTCAKGVKLR